METALEQVLKLAKLGWRIHPIASKNKMPLLDDWPNNASDNEQVIRGWAKKYKDCNWGVVTGASSNIFVVDIDVKAGGVSSWNALIKKYNKGEPIKTVEVLTGTKGAHLYFAHPGRLLPNSASSLGKGLDIRGENGNIILPPSVHPNGNLYYWVEASSPFECEPAPAPAWLLKLIKNGKPITETKVGGKLERGSRNDVIFTNALAAAKAGQDKELALSLMKQWVKETKNFDMSVSEIEATVDSAYKHYEDKLNDLTLLVQNEQTDQAAAQMVIDHRGEDIRYTTEMGYFVWDGMRWKEDIESLKVQQIVIDTVYAYRDHILDQLKEVEGNGQIERALQGVLKWVRNLHNNQRRNAVVETMRSHPSVAVSLDRFDGPDTINLLNFRNGTYNLETGELRPHNKEDHLTRLIDIDFNPKAKCPNWLKMLDLAFAKDKELIDYFQRAIGYTVSGSTAEQCFFICWGPQGANGKTTMFETLSSILGRDYAVSTNSDVVLSKDKTNYAVLGSLAQLNKTRLVTLSEVNDSAAFDEALIKQITGGDQMTAKILYHNTFSFVPSFKLWIRANDRPQVRNGGDSFWRRVRLIPFLHSIPVKLRRNNDEVKRELIAEAQGIINWAIDGYKQWQAAGHLNEPNSVREAGSTYKDESDVITRFWQDCIIPGKGSNIARSTLYRAYSSWSHENGDRYVLPSFAFGKKLAVKLESMGLKQSSASTWEGFTLNKDAIQNYGGF